MHILGVGVGERLKRLEGKKTNMVAEKSITIEAAIEQIWDKLEDIDDMVVEITGLVKDAYTYKRWRDEKIDVNHLAMMVKMDRIEKKLDRILEKQEGKNE